MGDWQSGDVIANGIRLHYVRTGGSKPSLVMAHGYSDDGLCWTPVAQELAADYDVIMVDARCHGRSEAPEPPYGPADQVNDLAGAITVLGLSKPLIFGHSMGASTTLALAGIYPDIPRAILLEDPPAVWMPESNPPPTGPQPSGEEWRQRTRTWLRDLQSKTREQLIADQRAAAPRWSEAELGPWADSKLRLHPNVGNRNRDARLDWQSLIPRIACPALLITGDSEKGAIVKPDQAETLRSMLPQLRIAHIPGAGHCVHREGMDLSMQAIRSFLSEVA
jgi:N-formylmaleamate deformylase